MSEALLTTARAHLEALAAGPRQTGTSSVAAARAHCANALREVGFTVAEEEFEYSAFPGRFGTPIAGLFALAVLRAASAMSAFGSPGGALAAAIIGTALLGVVGRWMTRSGVLSMRLFRNSGVNLVARRGQTEPVVWLVAHVDSKSQPVPMVLRVAALVLLAAAWLATIVVTAIQLAGVHVDLAWTIVRAVALISALPVIATFVGNRSAGAVDNASGVVAVLLATTIMPSAAPIGVLITDAEELGLAGARAWARGRVPAAALNCDGVDDAGAFTIMHSGSPPGRVLEAFKNAASRCRLDGPSVRHVLPGILVDAVALHDAGFATATLSRGNPRTLQRIHTSRDDLRHLAGTGIPDAARLLAFAALELCSWRS